MSLLGAAEIRALAERLGVHPTKKLGQNFVHDANTVRRIVQLADLDAGARVLEIGPGLGSLTLGLLEQGHPVVAVEIDERLAAELPATVEQHVPGAELEVVREDAMRLGRLTPAPAALVANLPYNISVPVFLHVLATMPGIRRALVMVQAEVGERMAAAPGSKAYGGPSAKIAWYGRARVAGRVSRDVFWPVPNVDSVLVGFDRADRDLAAVTAEFATGGIPAPVLDEDVRRTVFATIDAAFGQRRKMLRQALSETLGGSEAATRILESAGVAPTARGEELDIDAFIRIALAIMSRAVERAPGSDA